MTTPEPRPRYLCDRQRHLICLPYTIAGLHAMAADLGLKRCWYHPGDKPHYDIPKRRLAQIQARCNIVTPREILQHIASALASDSAR